jgi:drug/metabolite transporter (DMT)-like permease
VKTTANLTPSLANPRKLTPKEFAVRLALYVLIGAVIPFCFLVWRFNLFAPKPSQESVTIGGWGIVGIVFIAIFFLKTLKAIRKGMIFSAYTKAIDATTKIFIPLLLAIIIIYFMGTIQEELLQFLMVVFICEIPAAAVNPIPRWAYENKLEEVSFNASKIISSIKEHLGKDEKK